MILGSFLLLVTGMANSWSNSVWVFAFVRFLIGCSVNFTKIVAFTYIIEILGAKQRSYMAIQVMVFFALGELLLAYPFGILLRDWRKFAVFRVSNSSPFVDYHVLYSEQLSMVNQ